MRSSLSSALKRTISRLRQYLQISMIRIGAVALIGLAVAVWVFLAQTGAPTRTAVHGAGNVNATAAQLSTSRSKVLQAAETPVPPISADFDRDIFYDAQGLIIHLATQNYADAPINKVPCTADMIGNTNCQDGGDTAQREGWYWLAKKICLDHPDLHCRMPTRKLTFDAVLAKLEPNHDGVFYRHPTLPHWNNPWSHDLGFTRDQLIPLVAAMGAWGKHDAILRLWNKLPQDRLGKHTFNGSWVSITDICSALPKDFNQSGLDADKCRKFLTPGPKLPARNCSAIQDVNCDPLPSCDKALGTTSCGVGQALEPCSALPISCPTPTVPAACALDTVTIPSKIWSFCPGPEVDAMCPGPDIKGKVPGPQICPPCAHGICAPGPCVRGPDVDGMVPGPPVACKKHLSIPCMVVGPALHSQACISPRCLACQANYDLALHKIADDQAQCTATAQIDESFCSASKLATIQVTRCITSHPVAATNEAICEATKFPLVTKCKATKEALDLACTLQNVFSGDIVTPPVVNLFRAAMGTDAYRLNLELPTPETDPPVVVGEVTLGTGVGDRNNAASASRDDTSDDLNLIILLLRTKGTVYAAGQPQDAAGFFGRTRPYSYGSYIGAYLAHYCDSEWTSTNLDVMEDVKKRIEAGIVSGGWQPDLPAVYGAVLWYQRPQTGANPLLAQLYRPILDRFINDPRKVQSAPPPKECH